jgi:hydrogenase 3 maturation protease
MSNSSKKIAVIGIGNPLRKDDGIGIVVLDQLIVRVGAYCNTPLQNQFDFFDFGTSAIDLATKLSGYKRSLIIDGINAGLKPGQMKIFGLNEIASQNIKENLSSTHQIDLGQLLSLTKSVGAYCNTPLLDTEIYVAGIQVEDVSFGQGLSQSLKNNIDSYIRGIEEFLNSL